MMFTYKIDDALSLKLIELSDAEELFKLTNTSRAYLKEWLPWLDSITKLQDTQKFIKSSLNGFANNESMTTVILYEDAVAGVASYNSIDFSNNTAYIGYWLGEEFQGNGIMTRVANALTAHAFEVLALNKVDIRAAVENQKSRSIPERLGYVQEGTIRQAEWLYDHYVDHVVYGMLAEEWKEEKRVSR